MKRNQRRRAAAGSHIPAYVADMAMWVDAAMRKAGVAERDKRPFVDWTVELMWKSFKEERMNKRKIIENEINGLGIRLPNGTVNVHYSASLNNLPLEKISDVELVGAEELGLKFACADDGGYTLSGKPTAPGDYLLKLRYSTVEGEPKSELTIPVAFNPDPRSLWRNIPSNPNILFHKPDSTAEYLKVVAAADGTPGKDIVAASQRGRSHAQEGKPRDDHFRLCHCEESDWYIIAVADGAGSAEYSRRGSEIACDTVVDYCRHQLADNSDFESIIREYAADKTDKEKITEVSRGVIEVMYKGALKAHQAIRDMAEANNMNIRDFATTLMFAICKKFDFGWFIASFWVGDGAICLYDASNRTAKLLGSPDEGEFSGQTRFLTMHEIFRDKDVVAKRLRFTVVPDFTALMLMTDGVSDPMFETDRNLNDFARWEDFWHRLQSGFPADGIAGVELTDNSEASAGQLLKWLDFWSPGNHDDRTIAILY